MPTPDRLEELKRQRALLAEQMAKLDRESAAMSSAGEASAPPASAPEISEADRALEQFAEAPTNPAEIKRGCVRAFVWALALMAALLVAVYFVFYR